VLARGPACDPTNRHRRRQWWWYSVIR